MADFTPLQFTNGTDVEMAYTASDASQYRWEGWWAIGETERPMTLNERFIFGPDRPAVARLGQIFIATPV